MASQTPGIQQLLVAEKAASEKVSDARKSKYRVCGLIVSLIWSILVILSFFVKGKAKRLKQAKEEAKTEIEEYKRQTEQKYRDNEAKVCKEYCVISVYMLAR